MAITFFVWAREFPEKNYFRRLISFDSGNAVHKVRVWFSFDPRPRVFVATGGIVQRTIFLVERVDTTDANDFVDSMSGVTDKIAISNDW